MFFFFDMISKDNNLKGKQQIAYFLKPTYLRNPKRIKARIKHEMKMKMEMKRVRSIIYLTYDKTYINYV